MRVQLFTGFIHVIKFINSIYCLSSTEFCETFVNVFYGTFDPYMYFDYPILWIMQMYKQWTTFISTFAGVEVHLHCSPNASERKRIVPKRWSGNSLPNSRRRDSGTTKRNTRFVRHSPIRWSSEPVITERAAVFRFATVVSIFFFFIINKTITFRIITYYWVLFVWIIL